MNAPCQDNRYWNGGCGGMDCGGYLPRVSHCPVLNRRPGVCLRWTARGKYKVPLLLTPPPPLYFAPSSQISPTRSSLIVMKKLFGRDKPKNAKSPQQGRDIGSPGVAYTPQEVITLNLWHLVEQQSINAMLAEQSLLFTTASLPRPRFHSRFVRRPLGHRLLA